jgi:hypothetical protein
MSGPYSDYVNRGGGRDKKLQAFGNEIDKKIFTKSIIKKKLFNYGTNVNYVKSRSFVVVCNEYNIETQKDKIVKEILSEINEVLYAVYRFFLPCQNL